MKRRHRTGHSDGNTATDAGMRSTPSRGSENTSRTHQGFARKRKAQGSLATASSTKRHRNAREHELEKSAARSAESGDNDGVLHDDETNTHLQDVLVQNEYPEDATKLKADLRYDETGVLSQKEGTSKSNLAPKAESEGKHTRTWKCPFGTPNRDCAMRTFTRAADRDRHILFTHISISVLCTHRAHSSPTLLSRPDAVPRHMSKPCCLGTAKYNALKRKYAQRLGGDTESWEGRCAVHRKYIRIRMPCYQSEDVKGTLAALKVPRTLGQLEEWLSGYGKVERCTCAPCRKLPRSQPPVAKGKGGAKRGSTSRAGAAKSRHKVSVADDDERLPPEEEEGVDEDPDGSFPIVQSEHIPKSSHTNSAHASETAVGAASEDADVTNSQGAAGPGDGTAPDACSDSDLQQSIEMYATQTADLEDMLECDPTWGNGAVTSMPSEPVPDTGER